MALADRIAARFGFSRATAPIPFHSSANRFVGLEDSPNHDILLREVDSWAAIATRAIADRVASLEPIVFRRRRDASGTVVDEIIDDHPLKAILDNPNPLHSRRMTLSLIAQYVVNLGEAYLLKVTGANPIDLRELWVIVPVAQYALYAELLPTPSLWVLCVLRAWVSGLTR